MSDNKTMKVKLVRSLCGRIPRHQACARGLGLRRIHQVVEVEDTPATRGIVKKVQYMIEVLEDA